MTEGKKEISMFETVNRHDDLIIDHGQRISDLEEADRQHEDRLKQLEDQSIKLENTVMSESRETRRTFTENVDRLFDIVNSSITYKENTEKQAHEWRMQKLNTWSTVFLKISGGIVALLSAGGGAYYILQHFFENGGS